MSGRWRNPRALGRFVIATAALAGALSATGVALAARTAPHVHGTPQPQSALATTRAADTAVVATDSARLGQLLSAEYPARYGGLTVNEGPSITVYMTAMPKGLAARVQAAAPSTEVLFAHAAHTLGTLQAIHRELTTSWMSFQSQGVDIVGYAPDVATSREQIQIIAPTSSGVALLDRDFGSSRISIQDVGVAPIPTAYTSRVAAEVHAGVPFAILPVFAAIAGVGLLAAAAVLLLARRRRPQAA
jgi:hypothetical protein